MRKGLKGHCGEMATFMIGFQHFGGFSDSEMCMTDPGEKTMLTVPQSSTIQDLAKEYAKQKGMHIDDVGLVCGDCVYAGFNVALGATEPDASARGALLQSPWEANNDQINLAEELKQRNEAALRPLVARNRDGGTNRHDTPGPDTILKGGFVDLTMAESEIGAMRMLLNSARVCSRKEVEASTLVYIEHLSLM